MDVLFFVVLPLATILIAIVLQKLLKSPILVAILTFAVYLILAFTVFTTDFLINAIIYTILAFLTAVIARTICCLLRRMNCNNNSTCGCNSDNSSNDISELRTSINNLENSIETLEDNIQTLTELLSNNGCGCSASCNRWARR